MKNATLKIIIVVLLIFIIIQNFGYLKKNMGDIDNWWKNKDDSRTLNTKIKIIVLTKSILF